MYGSPNQKRGGKMVDYIWRKKYTHYFLQDEIQIIDRESYWRNEKTERVEIYIYIYIYIYTCLGAYI